MPREGIFAIVLEGGLVKIGDEIECIPADPERPLKESLEFIVDQLEHGIKILNGRDGECAGH